MYNLVEGYKRFRENVYPQKKDQFVRLATGQNPHTLFITCSDSRILPDMILQTGPGELFICRNAGNIVPAYDSTSGGGVSATIEYAVRALKVRQIIVCGHSDCGVMKGILAPEKVENMPNVTSWLRFGERARAVVEAIGADMGEHEKIQELARQNVLAQLDNLRTHPGVAARLATGDTTLHGWLYTIHTGTIDVWNPESRSFEPLDYSSAARELVRQTSAA